MPEDRTIKPGDCIDSRPSDGAAWPAETSLYVARLPPSSSWTSTVEPKLTTSPPVTSTTSAFARRSRHFAMSVTSYAT